MAILKLLETFCQQIAAEVVRFWWSNGNKARGIHWRRKEVICTPKAQGGLGFKDFTEMNLALLAKQAWRLIQEPQAYWASMLKGLYFPHGYFWNATKQRGSSWVWQSILQGRDVLKASGRWSIGSSQIVNIEGDNWLANGSQAKLKEGTTVTKVSELIDQNHNWDKNALRLNLEPTSTIAAIQTPISWHSTSDYSGILLLLGSTRSSQAIGGCWIKRANQLLSHLVLLPSQRSCGRQYGVPRFLIRLNILCGELAIML